MYARFYASFVLSTFLNPIIVVWTIRQSFGALLAGTRLLLRGAKPIKVMHVQLPFEGRWKVARGGVTRKYSHSWALPSQRYAYDFVSVHSPTLGKTGHTLENFPVFGRMILAAHPGSVVAARDDYRDHARPGSGWIDWRARDPRGNHVLVRHDDGVYALYAHLKKGSVAVSTGERVASGQPLGRCGNSGHSTEPHLHFQLQDGASLMTAIGLPVQFTDAHVIEPDEPEPVVFLREDQEVEEGKALATPVPDIAPPGGALADLMLILLSSAILLIGYLGLMFAVVGTLSAL